MSFFRKTLLITMLCGATAQAHDRPGFFEQIKQSYDMLTNHGNTPTHPIIEALGQEAQKTVGVEKPLPIYSTNPHHPMTNFVNAVTDDKGIHVNPLLKYQPYGLMRSSIYHEAIHVKENDYQNMKNKNLGGLLAGTITGYTVCRKLSLSRRMLGALIAGYITCVLTRLIVSQSIEARADREGFKATQCGICVAEMAAGREATEATYFNPLQYFGYVSPQEVAKIAQELKDKTCTYHAALEKQEEAKNNIAEYKKMIAQKQNSQKKL